MEKSKAQLTIEIKKLEEKLAQLIHERDNPTDYYFPGYVKITAGKIWTVKCELDILTKTRKSLDGKVENKESCSGSTATVRG